MGGIELRGNNKNISLLGLLERISKVDGKLNLPKIVIMAT